MKQLYFLIFILITAVGIAQTPNVIYYPNSVNTPTSLPMGSIEYLCGPNTFVYDTLTNGYKIYVSNNCTLTLKQHCPSPGTNYVYLQGNSVLNLLPGTCFSYVVYEPSATINNPMNAPILSNTVTTISWPTVNCTVNGIRSNNLEGEKLILYPNPASDELNISFNAQTKMEFLNLSIYNSIGQLIREEELSIKDNKAKLKTDDLENGVYVISLQQTQGDNAISGSKRFVIAR